MSTNLSINYVLSIKARILAKNPCIENTGIFGSSTQFTQSTQYTVYTVHSSHRTQYTQYTGYTYGGHAPERRGV